MSLERGKNWAREERCIVFLSHVKSPTLWQFRGVTTENSSWSNDHCRCNFFMGIISFSSLSSTKDSDRVLWPIPSSPFEEEKWRHTGKYWEEGGDSVKIPWPTPAETFPLPCQLLCLRGASVGGVILFALTSEDSDNSSINGMFILSFMKRRLSELMLWTTLVLLSLVLPDELPTSTTIDVVRESACAILRLFFWSLLLCCEHAWSSITPNLASEGRDAASFFVRSASFFLGFDFLAYSSN